MHITVKEIYKVAEMIVNEEKGKESNTGEVDLCKKV